MHTELEHPFSLFFYRFSQTPDRTCMGAGPLPGGSGRLRRPDDRCRWIKYSSTIIPGTMVRVETLGAFHGQDFQAGTRYNNLQIFLMYDVPGYGIWRIIIWEIRGLPCWFNAMVLEYSRTRTSFGMVTSMNKKQLEGANLSLRGQRSNLKGPTAAARLLARTPQTFNQKNTSWSLIIALITLMKSRSAHAGTVSRPGLSIPSSPAQEGPSHARVLLRKPRYACST